MSHHVACLWIIKSECKQAAETMLDAFKQHNGNWNKLKIVISKCFIYTNISIIVKSNKQNYVLLAKVYTMLYYNYTEKVVAKITAP